MSRIEVNCQTGVISTIELTQAEIDAAVAYAAANPPIDPLGDTNYRAMIRRRADTLVQQGKQYDALLLLKTIGE